MKKNIFKRIAALVAAVTTVVAMGTTAMAADVYHVAGDEGLTGAAWDTTKNEMTANGSTYEIKFTDVKAGDYGFKVVKGDSWGDAYNLEGSANGMGDDARVKVEKDGSTVTITFDGTKASVKVEEKKAEEPTTPKQEESTTPKQEESTTPKPADKEETPNTGDSSAVVLMLAVAAVAAGAVVVSRKRAVNE